MLEGLAAKADQEIKRSPISVRVTINRVVNGVLTTDQVVPDGTLCAALHHQFIGNYQGLTELKRLLANRKTELEDILKQQAQEERQNGNQQ